MIVAVGSWRGIGATTVALLLAHELAACHGSAWLVEADPAGGVLAGRLALPPAAVGGLEHVAFPTERVDAASALRGAAAPLGPLSLVSAPLDPFRAHACHQPRLPWVPALSELEAPVVVDVGRLRAGTPAWPVLHHATAVVLVTSPEVASAVSTAEWLRAGGRMSPADTGLRDGVARVAVVEAPGGVAFPRTTLQADLTGDWGTWGAWLPWEPATTDLLYRGAGPAERRLRRSALLAGVQALAASLPGLEPAGATTEATR